MDTQNSYLWLYEESCFFPFPQHVYSLTSFLRASVCFGKLDSPVPLIIHSSVLGWRIPGMEEPGGLPSYGVAQSRTRLKQLSGSSSTINQNAL